MLINILYFSTAESCQSILINTDAIAVIKPIQPLTPLPNHIEWYTLIMNSGDWFRIKDTEFEKILTYLKGGSS